MNYFSSQIIQQTPKLQIQGGVPFGRIVGQHPSQFQNGFPQGVGMVQPPPQLASGMSSPMMRSNLSVFQQAPPPQHTRNQISQHDLGQYLRSPQPKNVESQAKLQLTEPQRKQQTVNPQQHYIQPHYFPQQNILNQNNQTQKIQRQTSFHQQPLQNSRLTMQSLPAHNTSINGPTTTTVPSERLLSRNLSPQPQNRLNSLLASPVQRALSPQSQRVNGSGSNSNNNAQGGVYVQGNPYMFGGAQTLYSPTSRGQSPSVGQNQGLIFTGRNNFNQTQQTFYSSGSNFYNKANSLPLQTQQQQVIPFKLELPQKVQDNQQKLNEAIAKSEKIKKLVAEKQQQMKANEQKRNELLEVSKLHDLTPQLTAEKAKKQHSPQKYEESPIKTIQNVINTKKQNTQTHPISSIVNTDSNLMPIGNFASAQQLEIQKKPLQAQKIEKLEDNDSTLNQINQNQAEFKKLQQEFKSAASKIKEITKQQLMHTPINLLQKGTTKQEQQQQPPENKENFIIATPLSTAYAGDATPTGDSKSEFKSTVNQFRKSFQKNMYQTPVNNKKKFQKKVYDNEDEYQGGMENDIPNGYGILKDKNGKEIYKGDWKNGQYEGSGILVNRNDSQSQQSNLDHQDLSKIVELNQWTKYEGDMKSNQIQGFGTMYFFENLKYVGNLALGIPNGQGSFYTADGKVIAAIWDKGKLQEVLWD